MSLARAPDDFEAHGEGGNAIVVVGAADALAAEVAALEALGGDGPFPRVLESATDPRWGAYAALTAPPKGARPLVEAARALSVREALAVLREALEIAERIELVRFDWAPMRSDAFLDATGHLFFARLRSGRRLGPSELLMRAASARRWEALLPEPGNRGSPRLVRLLSAHYVVEADRALALQGARAICFNDVVRRGAARDAATRGPRA